MAVVDILIAILGISVLVIVHETGHYLAARAFGMRVLRFSIGLGPTLVKYQPQGSPTIFQVCAIPFLAYVQVAGMNPHEEIDPDDAGLFPNKSLFARIVTIAAGPFANYLTASVLVFGLALGGWPEEPLKPTVVREVLADSPAAAAGIRPGDHIVRANGEDVRDFAHLIQLTSPRAGRETEYIVERGGERLAPLTITPAPKNGVGVIGVAPKMTPRFRGVGEALEASVILPYELTVIQLEGLARLVRERSTEGITGPVGMVNHLSEQARHGVSDFLAMLMLLSIALGMFNLLPLPALDGGRLVFLLYELVTRRRPNERFEAVVHTVGLLFLLGVLVLVTFRDVMS